MKHNLVAVVGYHLLSLETLKKAGQAPCVANLPPVSSNDSELLKELIKCQTAEGTAVKALHSAGPKVYLWAMRLAVVHPHPNVSLDP